MSRWNHAICVECWRKREYSQSAPLESRFLDDPETFSWVNKDNVVMNVREPFVLKAHIRAVEDCCFCGLRTDAGIYMRADPKETMCGALNGYSAHKEDEP